MGLRIRFAYQTGSSLAISIERLSDGTFYDFSTSTFVATPAQPTTLLPEDTGIYKGRYKLTLATLPAAQFTDGDYTITVHNTNYLGTNTTEVVAQLAAAIFEGDDVTRFPTPWPQVVAATGTLTLSAKVSPIPASPIT